MKGDRLKGRHILVTGGGSGIGLETVARFREEGAAVALLDRPKVIAGLGGAAGPLVAADITRLDEVEAAVEKAVTDLGGLDGVVNCAGIDLEKPFTGMSDAEWNHVLAVNLTGPMNVCRLAIPHMVRSAPGTIVNIASAAGLVPLAHRAAYCASKAGLLMLGKSLAMELARSGIRVNSVCPGAVDTPLFRTSYEGFPDQAARYEAIEKRYALKRVAEPREIADAILYLTGNESSFVTGATLAVDGGRSFH